MTDQSSLRDLRFMKLMIDIVGNGRGTVSLPQLEDWLNRMVRRPITAKSGDICQLTRAQNSKGETTFWLSAVGEESANV